MIFLWLLAFWLTEYWYCKEKLHVDDFRGCWDGVKVRQSILPVSFP